MDLGRVTPLDRFHERLIASLDAGTFVQLVLSGAGESSETPEKAIGRHVELRRGPVVSFTLRFARRDVTENVALADVPGWVAARVPSLFRNALLGTTERDWQLHVSAAGEARLAGHRPARRDVPPASHDRPKVTLIDGSAQPWLEALGVVDASGRVRPSKADKHAQIRRYVEIVSHLARECGFADAPPVIVDMGAGKGYLTFAVWHLFRRVLGLEARVVGVEARPELVNECNRAAAACGVAGLEFVAGDIGGVVLDRADVLIALHACDTATDDAIRRGVALDARLVIVAPCCHRELRPQLGRPAPLAGALRHGLMQERLAEWGTDALRAAVLEWAGYETRVIEFVGSEHTPKNVMIAGIRRQAPFSSPEARARVIELKRFLGVEQQALDPLLDARAEVGR